MRQARRNSQRRSDGDDPRDTDNITLYWLTNTGVSASRLYWEYKGGFFNARGVSIPVAVTVFPGEQYHAPPSWTERAYPKLIHYNKVDIGGHFAAWEQPRLFAAEVRAAFRSLRYGPRREGGPPMTLSAGHARDSRAVMGSELRQED